jgi:transcriptional regulator with GAF, ATPase, and Fis domain
VPSFKVAANTDSFRIGPAPDETETEEPTFAGLTILWAPNHRLMAPAFTFDKPDVVVGRAPTCSVTLAENSVSREHAAFSYADGHWTVRDLGSRHGTLVNRERVPTARLRQGDEIRLGHIVLKFVESAAERYAHYPLDGSKAGDTIAEGVARDRRILVGGHQIDSLLQSLAPIAPSSLPVMLTGESGTGKELFAHAVHKASGRSGELIPLNAAALPESLLESELFGARRGAFTGADRDRSGLLRAAEGGTLFLDEVGELPLSIQAKLLRVVEQGEFVPLGGARVEKVDVRIICATHQPLAAMVEKGTFRRDLFVRLSGYSLHLPPLRERPEDLIHLVRRFVRASPRPELSFEGAFLEGLLAYDFPGNVRELERVIQVAVLQAPGDQLTEAQWPASVRAAMAGLGTPRPASPVAPAPAPAPSAAPPSEMPDGDTLAALFAEHGHKVAALARALGRPRVTVYRWLEQHGIQREKGEPE